MFSNAWWAFRLRHTDRRLIEPRGATSELLRSERRSDVLFTFNYDSDHKSQSYQQVLVRTVCRLLSSACYLWQLDGVQTNPNPNRTTGMQDDSQMLLQQHRTAARNNKVPTLGSWLHFSFCHFALLSPHSWLRRVKLSLTHFQVTPSNC